MSITSEQKRKLSLVYPELAGIFEHQASTAEMIKILGNFVDKIEVTKGDDGYTPIKGLDFYTDEDKQELVSELYALIPVPRDGTPGKDAQEVDVEKLFRRLLNRIPEPIPGKKGKDGTEIDAQTIVEKLNSLEASLDIKVLKDPEGLLSPFEKRLGSLEKSNTLNPKGSIDQRWKGGGLSSVSHDSTLIGLGTPASPLSVVGGSSGTPIYGEIVTPIGTSFTLANTPVAGTTRLYRGGARQQIGALNDYTMAGAVGTLAIAAVSGEVFLMDYSF